MSELVGITASVLAPGALLGLVALMVFTGRLVPRSSLEDLLAARDARIVELRQLADDWKDAYCRAEETKVTLVAQLRELSEVGRTATAVISALPHAPEKEK